MSLELDLRITKTKKDENCLSERNAKRCRMNG